MGGDYFWISLVLVIAIVCHWRIRNCFLAVVVASLTSGFAVCLITFTVTGNLDPYFVHFFMQSTVFAIPVCLAVGIPFFIQRRPKPQPEPGCCRTCGYNLTGNTSGICPECGKKIEPAVTLHGP